MISYCSIRSKGGSPSMAAAINVKAKVLLSPFPSFTATPDHFHATLEAPRRSRLLSKKRVRPEDVRCYPATGGDRKSQTMARPQERLRATARVQSRPCICGARSEKTFLETDTWLKDVHFEHVKNVSRGCGRDCTSSTWQLQEGATNDTRSICRTGLS